MIQLLKLCSFLALIYELACADPLNDPPDELCSSTSNYTAGSPFENNLKDLFLSLSSNSSITKFYNTSSGNDPDRDYGLYVLQLRRWKRLSELCKPCNNRHC